MDKLFQLEASCHHGTISITLISPSLTIGYRSPVQPASFCFFLTVRIYWPDTTFPSPLPQPADSGSSHQSRFKYPASASAVTLHYRRLPQVPTTSRRRLRWKNPMVRYLNSSCPHPYPGGNHYPCDGRFRIRGDRHTRPVPF